jgi:hypothetical protein
LEVTHIDGLVLPSPDVHTLEAEEGLEGHTISACTRWYEEPEQRII